VFLAAPKERRVCLPNTRFMIHQPSGGAGGQSTDIAIQAKEILRTRERIARAIATQTGTPIERIRVDMERDYWMSAEEAIEFGIVWRVIESHADLKKCEAVSDSACGCPALRWLGAASGSHHRCSCCRTLRGPASLPHAPPVPSEHVGHPSEIGSVA